ncbi:single-stranded DNA-binding protein [Bacteroides heparinolyticus]|uniref:single-stranded DNA-binding protein n=1 Tax=Prevotella heparinolytica TaxID=28113 RepID=UPI0035A09FB2
MNRITLMGRLTKDIETKQLMSGMLVGNFTLAVEKDLTKEKKNELEREGKPTADFIRCKAFGKSADIISKWTAKGSRLLIEGTLNTSTYDKDGEKRYSTDVLVNRFFIIDFKKRESEPADYYDSFDVFDSSFADDSANVHF